MMFICAVTGCIFIQLYFIYSSETSFKQKLRQPPDRKMKEIT